jgi:hypothetical protein
VLQVREVGLHERASPSPKIKTLRERPRFFEVVYLERNVWGNEGWLNRAQINPQHVCCRMLLTKIYVIFYTAKIAGMSAGEHLSQEKLSGEVMEVLKDLEYLLAGVGFKAERNNLHSLICSILSSDLLMCWALI